MSDETPPRKHGADPHTPRSVSPRTGTPRRTTRAELSALHTEKSAAQIMEAKRVENIRRESLQLVVHMEKLGLSDHKHDAQIAADVSILKEDEAQLFSPIPKKFRDKGSRIPKNHNQGATPRVDTKNEYAITREFEDPKQRRECERLKPLPLEKNLKQIRRANGKKYQGAGSRYAALFKDEGDSSGGATTAHLDPYTEKGAARRQAIEAQKEAELSKMISSKPQTPRKEWVYKPKITKIAKDQLPGCATPR